MADTQRGDEVPSLPPRTWQIYLALDRPRTVAELSRDSRASESAVEGHLLALLREGLIFKTVGSTGERYRSIRPLSRERLDLVKARAASGSSRSHDIAADGAFLASGPRVDGMASSGVSDRAALLVGVLFIAFVVGLPLLALGTRIFGSDHEDPSSPGGREIPSHESRADCTKSAGELMDSMYGSWGSGGWVGHEDEYTSLVEACEGTD